METILQRTIYTLAELLVLSVLIVSAACSKGTPDSSQPTPPPTTANQGGLEDEGEVTITFATDEYQSGLYEPLMEEFNQQNPDITVQFVTLPQPEPGEPFEITDWNRMLASAADTTLTYGSYNVGSGGVTYFRDLGPLIDMDAAFDPDDFWPGALDACGDNEGRLLGVPFMIYINGIFYDEAAFEAASVPLPAPGWTWDDFAKSTAALAQQKGDAIRYGYAEPGYSSILIPLVGEYLDRTGGEVDPQALQAELKWYFDLVESQAVSPMHSIEDQQDWQDWADLFTSDARPAMWPGSISEPVPGANMVFDANDPFSGMAIRDFGFAPFPVSKDQARSGTSPANVTCGSISAGSQHPRAAWSWLSFLSRQWLVRDRNAAWEITQMPSRQSVADEVDFWNILPEKAVPGVRFALEHAWFGSLYSQTFYAVNTALAEAVNGNSDFAAAFEKAQAELTATPEPTPDTAEIVVATPPAPPPSDATVINYFYDGINYPNAPDFKALVEAFNNSHPDLFVKVSGDFSIQPDNNDWFGTMAEKYDCFSWYSISGEQNTQSLLSLNSFLEAEGPAFNQDFSPELLDQYRIEGELLGLPTFSQPQIMAYNVDLLEKHGLEPPSNDWTFDDFIQLATAVSSTSAGDQSYGFMTSEWDTLLLTGRGIQLYDLSADTAKIDTPEMLNALIWLNELNESGVLLVQGQNWEEINQAMTDGRIAFWMTQAGQPDYYFNPYEEPPYKIGAAPMPAIQDAGFGINWAMTRGNFISRNAQNPQGCWTWFKFLSEQPNAFPGVPARLSVADSPAWKAQVGEQNAQVYRIALARATPASEMPNPDQTVWPLYTWRSQVVSAVLKGEDPNQALADSQDKAETYLTCIEPVETAGMSDEEVQQEVMNCARQADPQGQWQ
jgi:ABC-type glycerol-3-phosphate transport system substrate-binding protein